MGRWERDLCVVRIGRMYRFGWIIGLSGGKGSLIRSLVRLSSGVSKPHQQDDQNRTRGSGPVPHGNAKLGNILKHGEHGAGQAHGDEDDSHQDLALRIALVDGIDGRANQVGDPVDSLLKLAHTG